MPSLSSWRPAPPLRASRQALFPVHLSPPALVYNLARGRFLPAESLSRNHEGERHPGLSPVGGLEQEGGVLALPINRPTEHAGNKVERGDLLEARTGRKLCPLLPTVAGPIEDPSIGCPSMLYIHKVYRDRGER